MNKDRQHYTTIWPTDDGESVEIIDQTALPHQFVIVRIASLAAMIVAIKTMQVRGAPLIGAAAAYGMALAAKSDSSADALQQAADSLLASRPTAVNLRWAVERMQACLHALPVNARAMAAWQEAAAICHEDIAINRAIGQHGLQLIRQALSVKVHALKLQSPKLQPATTAADNVAPLLFNILTHCNAGWLAAVDWGTALAPIYAAHDAGIALHVWVDETRPRNQGASLTAWELGQHGIAHTVIADNAGGHLMQHGQVDMVIVGADRVTRTGDVCNKIGTYLKALAAWDNRVPFYAAVPSPTIDWTIADGIAAIPIEERNGDEVRYMSGRLLENGIVVERTATVSLLPADSKVANPAFDVTPARLVTGIITERGLCSPTALQEMFHATT